MNQAARVSVSLAILFAALLVLQLRSTGEAVPLRKALLVQRDREQVVVLYWYHAQGSAIAGEVPTRIEMVKSALLRNRTDGAVVRVMRPVYRSARETSDRLVAYVQTLYPTLGDYLPS